MSNPNDDAELDSLVKEVRSSTRHLDIDSHIATAIATSRNKRGYDITVDAEYDGEFGGGNRNPKKLRRYQEEKLVQRAEQSHAAA